MKDRRVELLEVVQLGMAARSLIDSPMTQRILTDLRADSISAWRRAESSALRDEVWYFAKAVEAFGQRLEALVEDGEMAQMELNGELKGGVL